MASTPDITCTRRIEWDAAHRVLRHESKCASLHGHRYAAEITCSARQLDSVGRVIDFGAIKEIVGAWVDQHWDHTTLANSEDAALVTFVMEQDKRSVFVFAGEPTAENIASFLLTRAQRLLDAQGCEIKVEKVRVYETPNCYAEAYA